MPVRIGFCCLLLLSLTSCASVPDRYAFWRDNPPILAGTKKPNLGDVPTPPDVAATRADIATMRQKLTADRDASYQAAGVANAPENTDITFSELAPMTSATTARLETAATDDRAVAQGNSDVIYNYASGSSTSAYGTDDAVQVNSVNTLQGNAPAASNDPSVSIDWSALGGMPSTTMASSQSGQPSIYFRYGSARISASDRSIVRQVARQAGAGGVVVNAYASRQTGLNNPVAAKDINLRMSAQRASAVLRELAKAGVSANSVRLIANGDSMATGNDTADRRVDLRVN